MELCSDKLDELPRVVEREVIRQDGCHEAVSSLGRLLAFSASSHVSNRLIEMPPSPSCLCHEGRPAPGTPCSVGSGGDIKRRPSRRRMEPVEKTVLRPGSCRDAATRITDWSYPCAGWTSKRGRWSLSMGVCRLTGTMNRRRGLIFGRESRLGTQTPRMPTTFAWRQDIYDIVYTNKPVHVIY